MKLMLVDDCSLFIEGLQYFLKTFGISIEWTVRNCTEVLEKARILKPDIILINIKLISEKSELNALKFIKVEMPEIKIIMLNILEEENNLFDAVKYKTSLPCLDIRFLREERSNDLYNSPNLNINFKDSKVHKLTRRQLEILELIASGITYKETAEVLGLTERTVKYHVNRIINLLNLENRSQVIAYAARIGLVENNN